MNMSRTFVCVNNLRKGAARMDESDEAFAVVYTKIQHLKLLRMNWNKTIFQVHTFAPFIFVVTFTFQLN